MQGRIRPTSAWALVGFALTGLVLGRLLRAAATAVNGYAPTVGWVPVLALVLVAAIVNAVAFSTYRTLRVRNQRLVPEHAVNRLVLAKSCALAGAAVGAAYLGYALSWLGADSDAARTRIVHSLVGAAAGIAIVVGSLLLERACRVRPSDEGDLP